MDEVDKKPQRCIPNDSNLGLYYQSCQENLKILIKRKSMIDVVVDFGYQQQRKKKKKEIKKRARQI